VLVQNSTHDALFEINTTTIHDYGTTPEGHSPCALSQVRLQVISCAGDATIHFFDSVVKFEFVDGPMEKGTCVRASSTLAWDETFLGWRAENSQL
jgi:hypothetical protein